MQRQGITNGQIGQGFRYESVTFIFLVIDPWWYPEVD